MQEKNDLNPTQNQKGIDDFKLGGYMFPPMLAVSASAAIPEVVVCMIAKKPAISIMKPMMTLAQV